MTEARRVLGYGGDEVQTIEPSVRDPLRKEPRCRICRDEAVRRHVDRMLDWCGVPVPLGNRSFHRITYAEIHRALTRFTEDRGPGSRITYDCLWVHAKRHYASDGVADYWATRLSREFRRGFVQRSRIASL